MLLAIPAPAAVTDEDIDRARQEVNQILADSQELGSEVQAAWARQLSLEHEIESLIASIAFARAQIEEAEARVEEAAVELYMGSTSVASLQILFSASDEQYGAVVGYLEEVSGNEDDLVNQLRSFRTELDRQSTRLAEASAEQEVLTAELEQMGTHVVIV